MHSELSKLTQSVAASIALVGTAACWWFYVGPYQWLSELQLRTIGEYYLELSLILTMLAFLMAVLVPMHFAFGTPIFNRSAARDPHHMVITPAVLAAFLGPAAVACLVAGQYARSVAADKSLHTIDAAELQSGNFGRSHLLAVDQPTLEGVGFGSSNRQPTYYFPVVHEGWQPGDPVNLVVSTTTNIQPTGIPSHLRGMRWPGGVPGPVRHAFKSSGLDVSNAILVCSGETPESWADAGLLLLIGGGAGGFVALICGALALRNRRRARRDAPVPEDDSVPPVLRR